MSSPIEVSFSSEWTAPNGTSNKRSFNYREPGPAGTSPRPSGESTTTYSATRGSRANTDESSGGEWLPNSKVENIGRANKRSAGRERHGRTASVDGRQKKSGHDDKEKRRQGRGDSSTPEISSNDGGVFEYSGGHTRRSKDPQPYPESRANRTSTHDHQSGRRRDDRANRSRSREYVKSGRKRGHEARRTRSPSPSSSRYTTDDPGPSESGRHRTSGTKRKTYVESVKPYSRGTRKPERGKQQDESRTVSDSPTVSDSSNDGRKHRKYHRSQMSAKRQAWVRR